jgi:hypothetical protein
MFNAPPVTAAPGVPTRARVPQMNATKCADIVTRVQLGETLSDADRTVLQTSCGR